MSSQDAAHSDETQQTKSEKYDSLVISPSRKQSQNFRHVRSPTIDFTRNLIKELDRNFNKEEAVRRRIMFGTPHDVIHAKVKGAVSTITPKDADGDWEIVDKSDKEEEDDYVVIPGKIRKTKTYTSNLAKAGNESGK